MKPYGIFTAIISTFFVSALLHGVNFQLAAVLLSLGFATYAEYGIRQKCARTFNACLLAHPCVGCTHRFKGNNLLVRLYNLQFFLLAIFHLAYLGVIFDGTSEHLDLSQSFAHLHIQWGNLNYKSHWIIFGTLIINLICGIRF